MGNRIQENEEKTNEATCTGYIEADGYTAECDDCIWIEGLDGGEFCTYGDSGSLVVSQSPLTPHDFKPVVGLLFAGGTYDPRVGVACSIGNVFSELDLTTLCAGFLSSFLDALMTPEEEHARKMVPSGFSVGRKPTPQTHDGHTGLARDIQTRIQGSALGGRLVHFVDSHRAELVEMLLRDTEVRSAAVSALRPILAGAKRSTMFCNGQFMTKTIDD